MSPTPKHDNTTDILASLGQLSDKDRCIFWFEWHAKGGFIHELPTSHCHGHLRDHMDVRCAVQAPRQRLCRANHYPRFFLDRLGTFRAWLNLAVEWLAGPDDFEHSFHFYVDFTDGHRHSDELFKALGAPILVQSKWSGDTYSIPVADTHMLLGHLLALGVDMGSSLHAVQEGAHELCRRCT
jgi:hypothetical protein